MIDRDNAVPLVSSNVIARRETNGVLLFHQPSDELFFISTAAYELVKLCDGSRTVAELCKLVAASSTKPLSQDSAAQIERFLLALADREVIEWWT